jgi:hypothetical protein
MRFIKLFVGIAVVSVLVTACNQRQSVGQVETVPQVLVGQTKLCEVSSWRYDEVASECQPGQKVAFLPKSWGNEQLPVIFAAVNCDLRYSVALTNGAVTCIYGPITPTPTKPAN